MNTDYESAIWAEHHRALSANLHKLILWIWTRIRRWRGADPAPPRSKQGENTAKLFYPLI